MQFGTTADSFHGLVGEAHSGAPPCGAAAPSAVPRPERPTERHRVLRPAPGAHSGNAAPANFVALSRFAVAHMTDPVKQAFKQRPHRVDAATGFVRMDVLSPCDAPDEIWLITYWKDEPSYHTWHHSHLYQESHQGIPKGTRLQPNSVSIRFFEHVSS